MKTSSVNLKEDNLSVVQNFFDFYEKGNVDGLRKVISSNVTWHIPGRHPLAGTKRGIDEILSFFEQLKKCDFKADLHILSNNDKYVIDCHRGWGEYKGNKIDMNWVLLFKVEYGKIQSVENFPGDQHAADDFFWKVFSLKPIPDRLASDSEKR